MKHRHPLCYLRTHRRAWGLSQAELAKLLGLGTSCVYRLERSKCKSGPSYETALACQVLFGIEPRDMYPTIHRQVEDRVIQAFVVFQGPSVPFDWGLRGIGNPSRNRKCLEAVADLIDQFQPLSIVLEDTSDRESRRTARIRRLYQSVLHLASANAIEVHRIEKASIRKVFGSVGAQAIAIQIPAFAPRLPRARKPWMSQDERQCLFDAAALGVTYFAGESHTPYTARQAA